MSESVLRVKPRLRGVSHQFACFVALGAGAVLVALAPVGAKLATAIYALALVSLFAISALYHRPTWSASARQRMRRLDHASIFLLIAGTYTPFCALGLDAEIGPRLLGIVWAGALAGICQSLFWIQAPKVLVTLIYLVLGWALVPYTPELWRTVGPPGLILIVVGGVLYSVGAVIYALRRPDPLPQVFGYHEIFHALVIAASVCHFAAIIFVVRATGGGP